MLYPLGDHFSLLNTLLGKLLPAVNLCMCLLAFPVTAPCLSTVLCLCVCVCSSDEFCGFGGHRWKELKTVTRRVTRPASTGGRRASERLRKAPATEGCQVLFAIKCIPQLDTRTYCNSGSCSRILRYDHYGWGRTWVPCILSYKIQNSPLSFP